MELQYGIVIHVILVHMRVRNTGNVVAKTDHQIAKISGYTVYPEGILLILLLDNICQSLSQPINIVLVKVGGGFIQSQQSTVKAEGLSQGKSDDDTC